MIPIHATPYLTGVPMASRSLANILSGLTLSTPDTFPDVTEAEYSGLAQIFPTRGHEAYSKTGSWSSLSSTTTVRVVVVLRRAPGVCARSCGDGKGQG